MPRPPGNNALLRPSAGFMVVNSPLIRPYLPWGDFANLHALQDLGRSSGDSWRCLPTTFLQGRTVKLRRGVYNKALFVGIPFLTHQHFHEVFRSFPSN